MRDSMAPQLEDCTCTAAGKDIRLTVVGLHHENEDTIQIDLMRTLRKMKRSLALWLCLAVGVGALAGSAGLAFQQIFGVENVQALISFTQEGSSTNYNVRKLKSPAVVEETLNELGLNIQDVENIRNAIDLSAVIPDNVHEKLSMYYEVLSQGDASAESVIQTLLNTPYDVSRYIVSFDCSAVGMSEEEGILFVNTLLREYQDYFTENYEFNNAMGNALNGVDYREYDYAEAVEIFSTALSNITSYLSSVENNGAEGFRSTATGFTFDDLRRMAATLRNIDLDRVSSYIVLHNVSSHDAQTEIAYYQWRIDNLTRQRTVERTRLASLTRSIEEYEKDPILVAVQDGNSVVANLQDLNANYDAMITEKLNAQAAIASCSRSISFYESVIAGFQDAGVSTAADIEKVEQYLAGLNEKINTLIENTAKTVDDYYDNVVFANRVRVVIPANVNETKHFIVVIVIAVLAVEAVLVCVFLSLAFLAGIREEEGTQERKESGHEDAHMTSDQAGS